MKEEGKRGNKTFVSIIVIIGMVMVSALPMGVFGGGSLPYYDIEQDSLGNYHKAYIDNSSGNYEIYYTNDIGGNYSQDWNPPTRITNTTNDSLLLDLGIYLPTDTMFIIWEEITFLNQTRQINLTYYTLSRDYGSSWREPNRSYEKILLKYAEFDPLVEEPTVPSLPLSFADPYAYYIVQLKTPMIQEWWDGIESVGGVFCDYINNDAYVIWMNTSVKERVELLPYIRWMGYYHPIYKIPSELFNETGIIELNVMVIKETGGQENLAKVIAEIERLGGNITYNGSSNFIIRAEIDASKIYDIALIHEVKWIDKYLAIIYEMNHVRDFTGATLLHTNGFGGNYGGTRIYGGVMDNGIDADHSEFDTTLHATRGNPPEMAHGTKAFGVIFAEGDTPDAKGMLPNGKGIFFNADTLGRTEAAEILKNDYRGVFQSNSWSTGTYTGDYTTKSEENDEIVFTHDITMTYAIGNSNGQKPSTDSSAKNVIGVGGVLHFDNADRTDDEYDSTSGEGYTNDHRFKPDLVGPSDSVYTTTSGGGYEDFTGTSAATPVVSGSAGLVYEMYREDHFGNNPSSEYPHASTVKALLIANAHQYDFLTQANRQQQGWGMVDVGKIYEVGEDHFIVNEDIPLREGQWVNYNINVGSGLPLKISLVWTDVPGNPVKLRTLVNNLALKVVDPDGTQYWGNAGLYFLKWNAPSPDPNTLYPDQLNNVQNVFIENPMPGTWTISIWGYKINEDAYSNTPELDQPFALVASYRPSIPVQLYQGWNLISLPLEQEDTTLEVVLRSVSSYYTMVQYYDASDASDPWKHWGTDLTDLNHEMGFWIYIDGIPEITLFVSGLDFKENYESQGYVPVQLSRNAGSWNMVGYPSNRENILRNAGLNNLIWGTHIDSVFIYDTTLGRERELGSSESFELGRGYWFHMIALPTPPQWEVLIDT